MLKIVLPVSLFTSLLLWSGMLEALDFILHPVLSLMGLPSMAAVPILIGMLANLYGGIAAMASLPLNAHQMTLIAIFLLMAHNLIQESIIQGKSGINPFFVTAFRIFTAFTTTVIISSWLGAPSGEGMDKIHKIPQETLVEAIMDWIPSIITLSIKMFIIIMVIMVLLEITKTAGIVDSIKGYITPLLKLMGLNRDVGLIWITGVIFGLAYGGAVIVEEVKTTKLPPQELKLLHLSLSINHALIEDPLLFMTLGINAFWLYVPRFIAAAMSVHLTRSINRLRSSRA